MTIEQLIKRNFRGFSSLFSFFIDHHSTPAPLEVRTEYSILLITRQVIKIINSTISGKNHGKGPELPLQGTGSFFFSPLTAQTSRESILKRIAIMVDIKKEKQYKMKKTGNSNKTIKSRLSVYYGLNAHKWATKMEVGSLLSGKPDLVLKTNPKKT